MTSSIANETVDHSKNREPFSFYKFITNKYFLNVVSIVLFLALWDYVAKEKIFRDSLARPLEVYRLTYMKFAGTNLIGHIWASTQRVLIGFIAASVVAVPLGLFMALNKYVNAIVKPLFDLFKPMPPIAWVSIAILWFGIGEMSKVSSSSSVRSSPVCSMHTTACASLTPTCMTLSASSAASAGMKSSTYASPRRSPQSSPASRSPSAPLGPAFWPPN